MLKMLKNRLTIWLVAAAMAVALPRLCPGDWSFNVPGVGEPIPVDMLGFTCGGSGEGDVNVIVKIFRGTDQKGLGNGSVNSGLWAAPAQCGSTSWGAPGEDAIGKVYIYGDDVTVKDTNEDIVFVAAP